MPLFFKSETRKQAEQFRTIAYTAAADSELTQTEIASQAGVEQNTWSSWLNPHTDKNIPGFIIPLLPPIIRDRLLSYLCESAGGTFRSNIPMLKSLNGTIDDEIKELIVIEGTIIKNFDKEPQKALREISAMEQTVKRLRAEINKKLEPTS